MASAAKIGVELPPPTTVTYMLWIVKVVAVLWSGDIGSTMPVLRSQVNIGLSAQTSGIPWWTTDVGGYAGGHSQDPQYQPPKNEG